MMLSRHRPFYINPPSPAITYNPQPTLKLEQSNPYPLFYTTLHKQTKHPQWAVTAEPTAPATESRPAPATTTVPAKAAEYVPPS